MDYQLHFTQRSLDDLAEIISWIALDDPDAAASFGKSLLDHVDLLGRFPRLGSPLRKRQKVRKLLHTPIVVYYRVFEEKRIVQIIHLWHAARKLPKF